MAASETPESQSELPSKSSGTDVADPAGGLGGDESIATSPQPVATAETARARPLIYGEILFDLVTDPGEQSSGRFVLGGAPLNVAWNLAGFEFSPLMISAVGKDPLGTLAVDSIDARGLESAMVQEYREYPTGQALVRRDGEHIEFDLPLGQAYDHITPPQLDTYQDIGFSCFYHGSLACRSEISRKTLYRLIESIDAPRFVDINLRPPHFDLAWLPMLLAGASWVKLSGEELQELSGIDPADDSSTVQAVEQMRSKFGHATYLVTFGSKGAAAVVGSEIVRVPPAPIKQFRDAVGAGDAFSSAFIAGTLHQLPLDQSLASASKFASRICEIDGATTIDTTLYRGVFT